MRDTTNKRLRATRCCAGFIGLTAAVKRPENADYMAQILVFPSSDQIVEDAESGLLRLGTAVSRK